MKIDETKALSVAEIALEYHGYNPATNRDVARICFGEFNKLLSALPECGCAELVEALEKILAKFEDQCMTNFPIAIIAREALSRHAAASGEKEADNG